MYTSRSEPETVLMVQWLRYGLCHASKYPMTSHSNCFRTSSPTHGVRRQGRLALVRITSRLWPKYILVSCPAPLLIALNGMVLCRVNAPSVFLSHGARQLTLSGSQWLTMLSAYLPVVVTLRLVTSGHPGEAFRDMINRSCRPWARLSRSKTTVRTRAVRRKPSRMRFGSLFMTSTPRGLPLAGLGETVKHLPVFVKGLFLLVNGQSLLTEPTPIVVA